MAEVFDRYTDTVGNYHFNDVETGHHVIPNTVVGYVPQLKKTNADRIRAMSDEELAEWIVHKTDGNGFDGYEDRVKAWLEWLKQEVSE